MENMDPSILREAGARMAQQQAVQNAYRKGLHEASGYIAALLLLVRDLQTLEGEEPVLPFELILDDVQLSRILNVNLSVAADPTTRAVAFRVRENKPEDKGMIILPPNVPVPDRESKGD